MLQGFIVNLGGVLVWTEYGLIYGFENEKLGVGAEEITGHGSEIFSDSPTHENVK